MIRCHQYSRMGIFVNCPTKFVKAPGETRLGGGGAARKIDEGAPGSLVGMTLSNPDLRTPA